MLKSRHRWGLRAQLPYFVVPVTCKVQKRLIAQRHLTNSSRQSSLMALYHQLLLSPLDAVGIGIGPPGEFSLLAVRTSTPVSVTSNVCSVPMVSSEPQT